MAETIYYKRNVNYVIGGRHFIGDTTGFSLNAITPYVMVKKDNLRDFKIANKYALLEGLIVEVPEPSVDWETHNAINDDEAKELVKNYLQLKQTLEKIDSFSTAIKLLEIAKETNRPTKTLKLIELRVSELAPDENEEFSREDTKKGVE